MADLLMEFSSYLNALFSGRDQMLLSYKHNIKITIIEEIVSMFEQTVEIRSGNVENSTFLNRIDDYKTIFCSVGNPKVIHQIKKQILNQISFVCQITRETFV